MSGGYLRWTDYRSKEWPSAIKIEHHKTGAVVLYICSKNEQMAGLCNFIRMREAVLARLPPPWRADDPENNFAMA